MAKKKSSVTTTRRKKPSRSQESSRDKPEHSAVPSQEIPPSPDQSGGSSSQTKSTKIPEDIHEERIAKNLVKTVIALPSSTN